MKRKYLFLSLVLGLGLTSCEKFDNIVPAQYNKILSMKANGEQALKVYATGEVNEYDITVMKGGYENSATAAAKVDVMTEIEFAQWSQETGKSFVRIPESCFSLSDNDLQFASGDMYKVAKLSVDPNKLAAFIEETNTAYTGSGRPTPTYTIPLITTSQTDSVLATGNKLIYTLSSVTKPVVGYADVTNHEMTAEVAKEGGEITVPLRLQIDNIWDFAANLEVDAANTTFNAADYELADNGKVQFTVGNNGELKVKFKELKQAVGTLALKIKNLEGKGFGFDNQVLRVNVRVPKYPLTVGMLSSNAVEPSEGSLANLLDGSVDSYFHSEYTRGLTERHYLQTTFTEPVSAFGFTYTNRAPNGNAALYKFDIQVSTDGTNFTTLRTYDAANGDVLPMEGKGVFNSTNLKPAQPVKAVRLVCHRNKLGDRFFVLSEFAFFAI